MIIINISKRDLAKEKLIHKATPKIIKNGFKTLRMDDIATYMDVSKGTMYKYFSSKEDIIETVINNLIDYISQSVIDYKDSDDFYITTFQLLFEKSVLLGAYMPNLFLNDVKLIYPDLYHKLIESINLSQSESIAFYEKGKDNLIFNKVNENLIFLQNNILIRSLLDIKFLLSNNLTIYNALIDYYNLLKYQLISPIYLKNMDDSIILEKIKHISDKLTRDLFQM